MNCNLKLKRVGNNNAANTYYAIIDNQIFLKFTNENSINEVSLFPGMHKILFCSETKAFGILKIYSEAAYNVKIESDAEIEFDSSNKYFLSSVSGEATAEIRTNWWIASSLFSKLDYRCKRLK